MIVDTSAIIAIALLEPEARRLTEAITMAGYVRMGAPNFLQAALVIDNRAKPYVRARFDQYLHDADIDVVPFTAEMAVIACDAHRTYGGGRHPAQLNLGDCFAYALARSLRQPLLFKGNDFSQTDIEAAPY